MSDEKDLGWDMFPIQSAQGKETLKGETREHKVPK